MISNEEVIADQKQSWNKFSSGWQKWDLFIQNWLGPVGEAIIQKATLKSTDRVIDAATGTGEPGLSATKVVSSGEVVGTDVAEEMIQVAEEKAKAKGITNYSAVVASTYDLPFEDNSFDAAISRFGVIFSPDMLADIKELKRVVKPGGKISAGAWAEKEKNQWATLVPKIIHEVMQMDPPPPDAPGIFRCNEPDSLSNIMKEAGLKDVDKIEVTGEFKVDSPEEYWKMMTEIAAPIVGALSKADEGTQEVIYKKAMEELRANHLQGEQVVIPWSAWVVHGTK